MQSLVHAVFRQATATTLRDSVLQLETSEESECFRPLELDPSSWSFWISENRAPAVEAKHPAKARRLLEKHLNRGPGSGLEGR